MSAACAVMCKHVEVPYLASGCVLGNESEEGNHGKAAVLDLVVLHASSK